MGTVSVESGRRELLEAAGRCFADVGYDRVTVHLIALHAQISITEIEEHFSSKDEIFHAVAAGVFERFLDAQRLAAVPFAGPSDMLAAATGAFIETVFSVGKLFTVIEGRAQVDPQVGRGLRVAHSRILKCYIKFIERTFDSGDALPCADSATIARKLSEAQWVGAARLIGAPREVQQRFVAEMTGASERFIGLDMHAERIAG